MEPLCFAILKSLTPREVSTVLFDERVEDIPEDETADLVAITVETYTANRAYQIADHFRGRGIPVVMGGYHPTFLPDECLQHADAVVMGDAEETWPEVIADLRSHHLQPVYASQQFPSLDSIMPDRSIFEGKKYAPLSLVQYGRGCKFNCTFCSVSAFYGGNLRQRPVDKVVEEIKNCGRRHIVFADDNLFVNAEKARELFEALVPLDIKWSCQVSIDIARDPELVKLMARSHCICALIGFESLNPDSLLEINKVWNIKWQTFDEAISIFHDAGIMLYGTFMFGNDHDTPQSIEDAVDFAIHHKFALANFNPLTPMPGAPFYDRLKADGRLLHDRWWLDSEFHYGDATYKPLNMTADDLTRGCFSARSRFNTWRSIFKRLFDPYTNCRTPYRAGLHLLANYVSRKEIFSKQNRSLGRVNRSGHMSRGRQ